MSHLSAILFVLLAGTAWAASGTAAQHFYTQSDHIPVELTQVRLFLSSAMFFLLSWWTGSLRRGMRFVRRDPRILVQLAVFGVLGIMFVQYSYFEGIAAGDAAEFAVNTRETPEMLVVNPPRRGIGERLCAWVEDSGIEHVIYSSCNAKTLAADLVRMPSYKPVVARVLDMFPHTNHYEVMTLLRYG